jgi:uncharacterized protein (DUF433 family)
MAVFDRITHDPAVAGGQARIRDTHITVTELVRLSLSGHSQAAILQAYPALDAEDVHQAVAYGLQDVLACMSYWRHEGLNPLQQIRGYGDLLTGRSRGIDPADLSDTEKQAWLLIMRDASYRGAACWHHLGNRVYSHYRDELPVFAPEPLAVFLQSVRDESNKLEPDMQLHITAPQTSVMLRYSPRLTVAVTSLVTTGKNTFKPDVNLNVQVNSSSAHFIIERTFQYGGDKLTHLMSPPAAIATANFLLYQHDSQLTIQQKKDQVVFLFDLPLA